MSEKLKYSETSDKSVKELLKLRKEKHRKLMNIRFQKAAGEASVNDAEFSKTRKEIARINTRLNNMKNISE